MNDIVTDEIQKKSHVSDYIEVVIS